MPLFHGEPTFKGRAHTWGKTSGPQGADHPFRRKAARAVERYEKRTRDEQIITLAALELMGVPVGQHVEPAAALDALDRFVEDHELEHRGVDVVLSRFDTARYDHDEETNNDLF